MTALTLAKMVHIVSLLGLLYASLQKNRLLRPAQVELANVQRLRRFDKLSAATAGLMLLSGLAMMLIVGKPTAYYTTHPGMLAKLTIFCVASALVVWTKVAFRQALTNAQAMWPVPRAVRTVMYADFVGLIVMALLGYWVARGS